MKKSDKALEKPQGNLYVTPLEEVLRTSMLPYAEFVIMDRALPRVEDGLKPVQRRILYTMFEMGLLPDKPHKKSARIVGDCMGKYHPHGDSSVYDAMVRMAQDFNMGRTLVDGHGNFGSVDGDPAAAMRYTEARLEPLALELLRDLDKNTVPFSLNFDDSLKEPDMLPGRFPNLLVNGASGIAVGLATNIPPHNLAESIDAVVAYIDKPNIGLDELMKHLPAPDFPTGGFIVASELREAYKTGKGRITLRARMHVEGGDGDRKYLVITELPYQVNKANLLRRIAELREEKKEEFAPIVRVTDESDRGGMRAVVEMRGEFDLDALMAKLYKYTDLETTFGINAVAIADGKPMQLGLTEIIRHYVNYQRNVVLRRTKFDLSQAKERCHILEGLIVAVRNVDEVVAIIKGADSVSDARDKLRKRFELSERQAQAILDLRLARLTKLEVFKLEEELKRLEELIEKLTAIVGSQKLQLAVVREEILEIKKKYRTPRKSTLVFDPKDADPERTDVREPGVKSVVYLSAEGTVRCVPERTFAALDKPVTDRTRLGALAKEYCPVLSDEEVFVFTNYGNGVRVVAGRLERKSESGFKLGDFYEDARKGEKPVAIFPASQKKGFVLFVTQKGVLKKTAWSEYASVRSPFQALRLAEGDEVVAAETEREEDTIFFVSESGVCLNAKKDDVPAQGRTAGGVKGMSLKEGDRVLFASQVNGEGEIVVVSTMGRAKRVLVALVSVLGRNCKGVKIATLKEGEKILFADAVRMPYMIAAQTEDGMVEFSSEAVRIDETLSRGRAIPQLPKPPLFVCSLKYRDGTK